MSSIQEKIFHLQAFHSNSGTDPDVSTGRIHLHPLLRIGGLHFRHCKRSTNPKNNNNRRRLRAEKPEKKGARWKLFPSEPAAAPRSRSSQPSILREGLQFNSERIERRLPPEPASDRTTAAAHPPPRPLARLPQPPHRVHTTESMPGRHPNPRTAGEGSTGGQNRSFLVPRGRPWPAGCVEDGNGRGEGLKGGMNMGWEKGMWGCCWGGEGGREGGIKQV